MKVLLPCNRTEQVSLFSPPHSHARRHRWKRSRCVHCGLLKSKSLVKACDCGCGTPLAPGMETTRYKRLVFVFGHESYDLFEGMGV